MTQDQNKDGKKYSFIIYWTIAQKLNIMNQTTNFTILIRIWNHDFYITQKSNFCTAGHKYLNKMGLFLRKNIFLQTGFYSQLKQFSLTFEAMLMWFPSGFVGCTTDLIDKMHGLKEEQVWLRNMKKIKRNKRDFTYLP